jgi:phage shock protein A
MFRVAIQIKELISSNVTSVIESASNPAKMLTMLQREIEESIISLTGDHTRVTQNKRRLETSLTQHELKEADWGDKAKTAMDHGREDLARQALLAREDCRQAIVRLKDEITAADANLAEIDAAVRELEVKREETRAQAKAQIAADEAARAGAGGGAASRAEAHLNRINTLGQRAQFAAEDEGPARTNASVDREIEEMRRASAVEAELAALKAAAPAAPKKTVAKKR